ncbi:MAG: ABC transporter ATP-binding protein [Propionibacteriaceae bacterium]
MIGLFRYAVRLAPGLVFVSVLTAVVAAGLTVAQPLLLGQAVGRLPDAAAGTGVSSFVSFLLAFLVTIAVAQVVRTPQLPLSDALGAAREKDMLLRLNRITSDDPDQSSLDDPARMSKIRQLWERQWEISMGTQSVTGPLIEQGLAVVGVAVALGLVLAWWVPLVLMVGVVVTTVVFHRTVSTEFAVWTGQSEEQKHTLYAFRQATGPAAKELRIFGLGPYFRRRAWDMQTAALEPYWRQRRRRAGWNSLTGLARVAVGVAVIGYAGWLVSQGRLDLTGLATTIPLVITMTDIDLSASAEVTQGSVAMTWLDELEPDVTPRSVLRVQPVGDQPVATRPPGQPPATGRPPPRIVFDEVDFRYPGSDRPVLDRLTWELPAGTASALVGINGAGKSTLVKLLLGSYRPTHGQVLVDDVALGSLDRDELRAWQRRVAPITQDFVRLPLPAGDNVEIGTGFAWSGRIDMPTWPPTDRLDAVAERTAITDLVDQLSDAWATPLRQTTPGGTDLSGGEWQRLGLARALRAVEDGAGVLVLDEPAAALDVTAEARLVDGYLDLAQRVTSLVISHRFSVVRPVPQISVLANGRIVEQGDHDELMAAGGRYRTLFSLQASRYARGAAQSGDTA